MTIPTRAWLLWMSISTVIAIASAWFLGLFLRGLEAGYLLFAIGMGWSALTPELLRFISRRLL